MGIGDLARWVTETVYTLGYWGVAVLVTLENVFPPIPSELILPLAGFLAGQGRMNLLGVLLAATAGSLAGAYLLYGVGRGLGEGRIRRFTARFGRWLLVDEDDLDQAFRWFAGHSGHSVLIGRLIPGVRSLISIPAGIACMSLWRFTLWTALGSAVWNGVLIGLGWWLGNRWQVVGDYVNLLTYAVGAVLAGALALFLWRRRGRIRQAG